MFKKDNDPWVRTFTVSDPTLHKKGYTLYKVTSKVFPKNSIEAVTQVTVWKRYNDFKNLHKALSALHQGLYLKGTFPPFAKAKIFGRFDSAVIEERRQCALELLEFAAKYPPLFTSQVFVKFFEGGHVVDSPSEPEEKCVAEVLQPIILSTNVETHVTEPNPNNQESSEQGNNEENSDLLGGIWKHRQVGDDISLNSHTTEEEEDDQTTFTDDEPSKSVSDLSEFDPLADLNASKSTSELKSEDLCHEWLLSAFESFGATMAENDDTDVLLFPKPFSDISDLEMPSSSTLTNVSVETECTVVTNNQNVPSAEESFSLPHNQNLTESPGKETLSDPNAIPYVATAKNTILMAEEAERSNSFYKSFTFYKNAAEILLTGGKTEKCINIRRSLQKLIMNCLQNAERTYNKHLTDSETRTHPGVSSTKPVIQKEENSIGIRRSMKDLAKYRVIGILSKILLVLDVITNITCVVKVLRKSPQPQQANLPSIAPRNLDFIVQLYEVYETTDAIFLILEYANGGRLWDYISSYLQRSPLSPADDSNFHGVKQEIKHDLNNIYSGKKISMIKISNDIDVIPAEINSSLANDSVSAEIFPLSYAALFRNYAANMSEDTVSLAKCRTKSGLTVTTLDATYIKNEAVTKENQHFIDDKLNYLTPHINTNSNNETDKVLQHRVCEKNGIICDSKSPCISNEHKELSEHNIPTKTVQSVVSDWLNSCDEQSTNDTTISNTDLCTFLSGSAGKVFINQDFLNGEDETVSIETGHADAYTQKKIGFTEVFHNMDKRLSIANIKPTYLPESCIALWTAEIIVALESLHKLGIIWKDLRPENILLGSEGHILLSYQSQWNSVDYSISQKAIQNFYSAPEVCGVFPVTSVCDWWSLGAILFELITGQRLVSCYPSGITSHTNIQVPDGISTAAHDILQKLLKYNPSERLGSGEDGIGDIKCHPFFHSVTWDSLKCF